MSSFDIDLTATQCELYKEACDFAQRELEGFEKGETFSREAWSRCAEFGIMKMPIPKRYGGTEMTLTDLIVVMEALGYGCKDHGTLFSIHAHLWTTIIPILEFGTTEQKEEYLLKLGSGNWIGANAATEPAAGSDIFGRQTRAERNEHGYVINGTKTFITNAPSADIMVVFATVNPSLGPMGISAFVIETSTQGVTVSSNFEKMGLRTASMAKVAFEDCQIPRNSLLGREGRGVEVFECSMEWERGCILASCLGAMRRQLEECVKYARDRKQFGQQIGKFQSVAGRIVDMKVRLDTCRPLVYRVGSLKDAGSDARLEAAVAKLHVSESFVESSLDAMRIHGGYGYMVETGIERELRDALGGLFYSGTSDIQRNIIANCLGL